VILVEIENTKSYILYRYVIFETGNLSFFKYWAKNDAVFIAHKPSFSVEWGSISSS